MEEGVEGAGVGELACCRSPFPALDSANLEIKPLLDSERVRRLGLSRMVVARTRGELRERGVLGRDDVLRGESRERELNDVASDGKDEVELWRGGRGGPAGVGVSISDDGMEIVRDLRIGEVDSVGSVGEGSDGEEPVVGVGSNRF